MYTVGGERFAGLNIRGFSAIEVVTEIFLHCLGHKQYISTHYLREGFIFMEKLMISKRLHIFEFD